MNIISFIALGISLFAVGLNCLQFRDTHRETKRIREEHIDGITDDIMDACFPTAKHLTPSPQLELVMKQARIYVVKRLKQEI